ncbi:MAG: hypothetical protein WCI55_11375 [Armatimonadota bacterium]
MVGLGNETYRAFLMTDVVGSTMLTQKDPVVYGHALAAHNELAESTFKSCGGKLLKSRGQGDGLLGEFSSAADAVRAALAFQSALKSIPNPILTCRYAVHYGVCYGDGEDYFGHTLSLCARLRDVSHPDQILVSATVTTLATQLTSEGIQFYDLGWHGLKDISSATRIFQVDLVSKHQIFLKLKTDTRFRLPTFGTPFVGRHDELERVSSILATQQAVLLLGPGGIGKTRLSVRAAEAVTAKVTKSSVSGTYNFLFPETFNIVGGGQPEASIPVFASPPPPRDPRSTWDTAPRLRPYMENYYDWLVGHEQTQRSLNGSDDDN